MMFNLIIQPPQLGEFSSKLPGDPTKNNAQINRFFQKKGISFKSTCVCTAKLQQKNIRYFITVDPEGYKRVPFINMKEQHDLPLFTPLVHQDLLVSTSTNSINPQPGHPCMKSLTSLPVSKFTLDVMARR